MLLLSIGLERVGRGENVHVTLVSGGASAQIQDVFEARLNWYFLLTFRSWSVSILKYSCLLCRRTSIYDGDGDGNTMLWCHLVGSFLAALPFRA